MERKSQFLPTLLERLIDDEPRVEKERFDKFFFDSKKMRTIVQRDIAAIMNSTNIEDRLDSRRFKFVADSVLNYGIAAMVGNYANKHNWGTIEKAIRNALLRFEPRILAESLIVSPSIDSDHPSKNGLILFEIKGLILWKPHPIDLCINGAYDVETEKVDLKLV